MEWQNTKRFAWWPVRSSRKDRREYIWLTYYWKCYKESDNELVEYKAVLSDEDFIWWQLRKEYK